MDRPEFPYGSNCVYCSAPALEWDHVIARALTQQKRVYEPEDWIVPACRDCNSLLRARAITNIPERAAWLYARYRKKYAKLLTSASWTDEETEELGENLKRLVLETKVAQAELDLRLAHLRLIASKDWGYLRPR